MLNFRNFSFPLLYLCVFIGFVVAQPPPPASSSDIVSSKSAESVKDEFVSLDGGFIIALPQHPSGFEGIAVSATVKGGSQFYWQIPQGSFVVGYFERASTSENPKNELQAIANSLTEKSVANGGKMIGTKDISLNGTAGIEVKVLLKENAVAIARYYLVKNKMYIMTAGWDAKQDGATQLRILDSFKLIDGKSIMAKRLQEATPQPLPQDASFKKQTSDLEDDSLKGKVKSVVETQEDLTGTWSAAGVHTSSEDYYNEKGYKTKRLLYDYKGNPSTINIYGVIGGMKVSKSGNVNYEYNPPIMTITPGVAKPSPKSVDNRYDTKYEYRYDENGRMREVLDYRNDGELSRKTTYKYNVNKVYEYWYDESGKLTSQTVETFDDKLNLIEKIYVHNNADYPDTKYTFTYESFDEKGNWTKRVVKAKEGKYGGGYKDQHYIEYRIVIYHQ